jgi:hypothetical protein
MRVGAWTAAAAAHVGGGTGCASASWQLPLAPPARGCEAHPPGDTSGWATPAARRASVQSNAAAAAGRVCRAMARCAGCEAFSAVSSRGVHAAPGKRNSAPRRLAAVPRWHCAPPAAERYALHRGAAARRAAACGTPPGKDAGDARPSCCGAPLCCFSCTCGLRCCAAWRKPVSGARCSFTVPRGGVCRQPADVTPVAA